VTKIAGRSCTVEEAPMIEPTPQIEEQLDVEASWALLGRVASSAQLRRATRLKELLFYVGQRSIREGCDQIHEQEIGAKVFGRQDSYDTSFDNIVRTNVSDLRKRIEAYFNSEGLHENVIMEIPRGSYVPVFRNRQAEAHLDVEPLLNGAAATAESHADGAVTAGDPKRSRWMVAALVAEGLIAVLLAIGCVTLWMENRAVNRSFYAWQYKPSVAAFWTDFLGASPDTDVVMPDTSFAMLESISRKTFSFNDYLSRNYTSALDDPGLSPDTRIALGLIAARNLGTPSGFKLTQRILALDPLGKRIHPYYSRDYMPALLKRDNVILIGARIANPWDELFESRMNFTAKTENSFTSITNRAPAAGEQKVYIRTDSVGYCTVAYLPNPSSGGEVLLMEGTSAEATEAAGDFLLSEDQLSNFRNNLHITRFPYFEALLKISAVRGTPLTVTIEAYRTYPKH
jgi:hypothetical protein